MFFATSDKPTLPVTLAAATQPSQPIALGVAPPITASPPAPAELGLVYIIENDAISAVITELIVKKNLFARDVRCYANGQWAFDELLLTLREGGPLPDLIMLDLDMPLMDGWEFLDALANLSSVQATRVFVQTSSIHPDDQSKALSYKQVVGFFSKPLKEAGIARMRALLLPARPAA